MSRPLAQDHDEKRDVLLSTATKIFAEYGFDRASISQVASAFGVSKATLYHYYPSKNAILYAILHRHLTSLHAHLQGLSKEGKTQKEFLSYAIEEILLFYRGNDDVHHLQLQALSQLEAQDQKTLKAIMRQIVDYMAQSIKVLNPDKFKDEENLRMATMSLFGMLNWYYTWNTGRGIEARKKYAHYISNLLFEGMFKET